MILDNWRCHRRGAPQGQSTHRSVLKLHMHMDSTMANPDQSLPFHENACSMKKKQVRKDSPEMSLTELTFSYEGDIFVEKQGLIRIRHGRIHMHVQFENTTMST